MQCQALRDHTVPAFGWSAEGWHCARPSVVAVAIRQSLALRDRIEIVIRQQQDYE